MAAVSNQSVFLCFHNTVLTCLQATAGVHTGTKQPYNDSTASFADSLKRSITILYATPNVDL